MAETTTQIETAGDLDVLIVEIAGRRFGLPAAAIRELLRAAAIVPLAEAPGVEGALNLHGAVVPVIDVRGRLHLPPKPLEPSDQFVVVAIDSRLAVLRVDETLELVRLGAADLAPVDDALADSGCVLQFAKRPGQLVPLLNLGAILPRPPAASRSPALRKTPPGSDAEAPT